MSSRALRKLQREREEKAQLAQLASEQKDESEDSETDDAPLATRPAKKSAFELLNEAGSEDDSDDADVAQEEEENHNQPDHIESESDNVSKPAPSRKSKKKGKKKKKGKAKDSAQDQGEMPAAQRASLDEIDLALKALKVKPDNSQQNSQDVSMQEDLKILYSLLSTDSRQLNALNEMKKLFGSTVLEGENSGAGAARRRGRNPQQLDLGAALEGRNNPVSRGQGLSGLALRKNVLIPGKEEWPKATSGGLGMEIVEKADDLTIEYRFVHSSVYQNVQREFDVCVESMDPQRMIRLLQYNPYHISTLLQVSEIAKQQGDHSVAADLQERALFTFGRSVQSTFQHALNEGKARLDFRRPENREFWLAAWRYVVSLGQRGTWRTAYEWAKLILSLDPEEDPFRIRMIIDQLAIRGGQFEHFIQLAATDPSVVDWGQGSPNIQISLAMAHYKLKHAQECRSILSNCVQRYPWFFERLFKELNIEIIPVSVWGKEPRTPLEKLHTESYASRAKDIWSTPEALSLLVEVVETTKASEDAVAPQTNDEITRNEARHVLLSDVPALISILPRSYTTERTSSSDPLPPEDSEPYYGANVQEEEDSDAAFEAEFGPPRGEAQGGGIPGWFSTILSRFRLGGADREEGGAGPTEEDVLQAVADQAGTDVAELRNALRDQNRGLSRQERLEAEMIRQEDDELARAMQESMRDAQAGSEIHAPRGATEPPSTSANGPPAPTVEDEEPEPDTLPSAPPVSDEDANKRWLAGRGMLALKSFVAEHGSDESKWKDELEIDSRPATEYAFRVMQLRGKAGRDFILNYSLPQGAGKEAAELIRRMIA